MDQNRYAKLSAHERGVLHGEASQALWRAQDASADLLVLDARVEAARLLPEVQVIVFTSDPDEPNLEPLRFLRADGSTVNPNDPLMAQVDEMVFEALRAAQEIAGNRRFSHYEGIEGHGYELRIR